MNTLLDDPQYWNDRAEEARAKAADMKDPGNKRMMLKIAEGHERQAEQLEQPVLRVSVSSASKKR